MTRSSKWPPRWRRPPLVLVAVGLAIAYAELAIETEVLADNGLLAIKVTAENKSTNNVGGLSAMWTGAAPNRRLMKARTVTNIRP